MHPIQKKLLDLSQRYDLTAMGLSQIGKLIGERHPQKVKHHLQQLISRGLLPENRTLLKPILSEKVNNKGVALFSIPIYGAANCGPATLLAENNIEGHLQVSAKILPGKPSTIYAIRAIGSSMNCAYIDGKNIQNGDYVLVDSEDRLPRNGDYIVSIVGGAANIKQYFEDRQHHQIMLLSKSSEYYPPIYIHEDDFSEYLVAGKVVGVIKSPAAPEFQDPIYVRLPEE